MGVQGPEGLLFAGKYKIQKLIGRGGMANVYLAVDINSNVKVAIKIMKPEYASDEEFIRRFDSEAKAVSSLNHSNIVKVFGVGHEGNFRFIVQEYVDGITVKELINQNGHLDWHVAVPIVIQVGLALDYAHKNGIIHRDIKPQNILISRDRIAKVTDFGIARASTGNTITMTSGGALGSVHYFSPEQARGSSVSPASDVYSVGVMLFEMLTGRVPFDGDSNVAIAVKHLQEKAPLASTYVPDIPQGLDSIIQKCMQKVPEKRYSTMRQMVTELDALMVDPNGVYGVVSQSGNSNSEGKTSDDVKLNFRQDPSYDKVSDLEKSAEARRRQRLRDNFILALIIVMIVGVIIGLGKLVIDGIKINTPGSVQRGDYEVTNFQGKTIDEVTAELDSYGVKYNIKYVDREDMTPGIVISQSIPPTQKIGSNSLTIIELQVSKSPDAPDYYEIPNYYDVEYSIAVALLRQNGMVTTIVAEETDVVVAGHVIRTEPGFGESVEYGSNVTIYYAADSLIPVPRLQGMRYSEAVAKLGELNLMCSEEPTDSVKDLDKSEWYVIRTDPDPGKEVARNSQIRVYFGTYEDAMRGTTPTPTPAPVKVDVQIEGGVGTVTGAGEYIPGEQVILTAVPSEGYEFDCWKDSNGNILAYSDTYTFTPEENKSYSFTAWFKLGPTPTPGPTSTPTPTPTVAPTSTVTPTPVATATNTPTPTPVPTSTPTPTVAPTNTPTPTPTVAPTNTPTPVPELPPETEATTEATEPVVTETPVPEEEGA